jgi:MoxR-like ATPase
MSNKMRQAHLDIDRAIRMFGDDPKNPNKTFSELPDWKDLEKLSLVSSTSAAIAEGMNLLITGPSGVGKTEFVNAITPCFTVDGIPVEPVYFSCAVMTAESLKIAYPHLHKGSNRQILRYLLDQRLLTPGHKVLIWDEVGQAEKGLYNAIMEALSEKTIGNIYPNLISSIMLDNPNTGEYGHLNEMEYAQASRMVSIDINASDSPWPRAIAQKYHDIDMSKVIKTQNKYFTKFDTLSQGYASPRVLTQGLMFCLTTGFPTETAIPWGPDGERFQLRNAAGETAAKKDKDGKVIQTFNEAYIQDIGDAAGLPVVTRMDDNCFERAVDLVVQHGVSVYIEGSPGCGKTSKIKAVFAEKYPQIQTAYLSLANTNDDEIVIPFPGQNAGTFEEFGGEVGPMDQLTFGFFGVPGAKVGIFDEYTRGTNRVTNVINEVVQQHSTNGVAIPDYIGSVAINNPPFHAGEELDVRSLTLPQASRFAISFKVGEEETKSLEYLDEKYGEPIRPFIRWRKGSLNPAQQENISARVLEMMYKWYRRGKDMKEALPKVKGRRVDAPLVDLLKALNDQPMANLTAMSENLDLWIEKLSAQNEHGEVIHPDMHVDAYQALYYATLGHLKEKRDTVIEIFKVIDDEHRFRLIGQDDKPDVQEFWYNVLEDAIPEK